MERWYSRKEASHPRHNASAGDNTHLHPEIKWFSLYCLVSELTWLPHSNPIYLYQIVVVVRLGKSVE